MTVLVCKYVQQQQKQDKNVDYKIIKINFKNLKLKHKTHKNFEKINVSLKEYNIFKYNIILLKPFSFMLDSFNIYNKIV